MPKGVYLRKGRRWKPKTVKRHYRAMLAKQDVVKGHGKPSYPSRKGQMIDMSEDISLSVKRAYELIQDGKRMINQGWDLINSIPKRV